MVETVLSIFKSNGVPLGDISPYEAYQVLSTRTIGEPPSGFPILRLSDTATRTVLGVFAPFFNVPATDLRFRGSLTPSLRREAFRAASVKFNCKYCTAHACTLGDMLSGSRLRQSVQSGAATTDDDSEEEKAVAEFCAAASERPFPSYKLPELQKLADKVASIAGDPALAATKTIVAMAGILNTMNEALGSEVEPLISRFAAGEEISLSREAPMLRFFSWISEIGNLIVAIVKSTYTAETDFYKGLPRSANELRIWAEERLGEDCGKFVGNISDLQVRRSFCFALRENLFLEGHQERCWTSWHRAKFLQTFAEEVKDTALLNVVQKLREWDSDTRVSISEGSRERVALAFVQASAHGGDGQVEGRASVDLCKECEPEAVVELIGLISFFELWRRTALLFSF